MFRFTLVTNLIFRIIFVYSFTLNFFLLYIVVFRLSVINQFCLLQFFVFEFWVCFEHSTHTPRCSTPTPWFFVFEFWVYRRVFVWIDPTKCTKKKLSFPIPILISNFLRQRRYLWNRHHSYTVNIVFLNNLVQKYTFFIFCIFVFIRYKGERSL